MKEEKEDMEISSATYTPRVHPTPREVKQNLRDARRAVLYGSDRVNKTPSRIAFELAEIERWINHVLAGGES